MGSIGVDIRYERTRPSGGTPEAVLADVWARVGVQLDNLVSEDPVYGALLRTDYLALQDGHIAREGVLTFAFSDHAGCCHRSMYAFDHWTRRALWIIVDFQNDDLEAAHGCRLALPDGLVDDPTCLFVHDDRVFVPQQHGPDIRLVGDEEDVEVLGDETRAAVQALLANGVCPCPMCVVMRTHFGVGRGAPEPTPPPEPEPEAPAEPPPKRSWWRRLFG